MHGKPKSRIHSEDLLTKYLKSGEGKLEEIKDQYRCRFYVEAIGIQDTLRQMTGESYEIVQDGVNGWIFQGP